ncbi:MAG: 4'-phosphopantetheinyl transferase superfamily protein [Polyangiaceae bacterium]|nr:4'-phosphopantetheinyl transferase superfamily protein [Polyangiaceae bacterium]
MRHTPHGVLVGVCLPSQCVELSTPTILSRDEMSHAASLAHHRQPSWIGGRTALRIAAKELGIHLDTVLSTPRGAPAVAQSLIASISHKRRIAIALVAPVDLINRDPSDQLCTNTIGVDIEELDKPRPKIARLVLRPDEASIVDSLPQEHRWRAIATMFSTKESVFKAIDPHLQRYVGFAEASIRVIDNHNTSVQLHLSKESADTEGQFALDGWWDTIDNHVITSVRCRRRRLITQDLPAPLPAQSPCRREAP